MRGAQRRSGKEEEVKLNTGRPPPPPPPPPTGSPGSVSAGMRGARLQHGSAYPRRSHLLRFLLNHSGFISEHNLPEQLHRAGGQPDRERERHHGDKRVRRRLGERHHRSGRHRRPDAGRRAPRARPRRHGNRPPAALLLRRALTRSPEATSSPSAASPLVASRTLCPQGLLISPERSGERFSPDVEARTDGW
ncbi:hypothetical protein Q8A67_013159 [Cirrhinus molitorella]|uniref:Uncharacterized protein n=1 Tax=Cirrhinus molitorella TaxID=172907 RepID=A0AA88PUN7_9TELE|nr:hypothetical protein Q8A67_013159 [Cirrhinus molitorella]